jgi:predicted dehydrogenase
MPRATHPVRHRGEQPAPQPVVPHSPIGTPELGIAMVGHSFMGRAHSNAIRQVNHFFALPYRVVPRVVVGRQLERVEAAREKFGFQEASVDLEAVLGRDDIHIVDVATPNVSHHPIALAALRAGKHVLCEKPLAMTLQQAKEMVALARKGKARAGVWHNYRRCPAASLARRLIARGEIGDVRQVRAVYLQDWLSDPKAPSSWRTDHRVCGSGAHGDLNAHLIDMTMFLTGLRFKEVCALEQTFTRARRTASGKRVPVTVDDAFAFLARFDHGAIGTFESTRVAPGRKNYHKIEINGSRGSLEWDFERMNELRLFSFGDARDAQGFRTIMCMDPVHPYAANWWPDGHVLGYEHAFVHHLADFLLALSEGKPFSPDFEDGMRVQAVLESGLKSSATGRWVGVPRV